MNKENVRDLSYIICQSSSLLTLPDISKWNTENVRNMSFMFDYCSSLSNLPDISR